MNRLWSLALVIVSVTANLTGCQDRERNNQAWRLATRRLIDAYADAARRVLSDCGSDKMEAAKYPDIFFFNPGWNKWKGPYLLGKPRSLDYFETPIHFTLKTDQLLIVSAGPDKMFGTDDDIIASVKLR